MASSEYRLGLYIGFFSILGDQIVERTDQAAPSGGTVAWAAPTACFCIFAYVINTDIKWSPYSLFFITDMNIAESVQEYATTDDFAASFRAQQGENFLATMVLDMLIYFFIFVILYRLCFRLSRGQWTGQGTSVHWTTYSSNGTNWRSRFVLKHETRKGMLRAPV